MFPHPAITAVLERLPVEVPASDMFDIDWSCWRPGFVVYDDIGRSAATVSQHSLASL